MKKHVFHNFDFIWQSSARFFSTLFGFMVLGGAIVIGYFIASLSLQKQLTELTNTKQQLTHKTDLLFKQEQKNNFIAVELEVSKISLQKLQADLKLVQEENLNLTEKVNFYQNIMAPELSVEGITLDSLHIEPTVIKNNYRYKVVLIQTQKQKRFIKGNITLSIIGTGDNGKRTIDLHKIASDTNQFKFSFQYFQNLEGDFILPEGFKAQRIKLSIIVPRRNGQKYQRTDAEYDWSPEIVYHD